MSILLTICITPLNTYASVFMQQSVIDAISEGKSIVQILFVIVFFQAIIFATSILPEMWFRLYVEKKQVFFSARVNHEIMKKVLKVDYKHFDNPEYYDSYTWAAREYANRVDGAKGILLSLCSSLFTLTTLLAYLTVNSPIVILCTILIMIVSLLFNTQINKLNVKKQEQVLVSDRKIGYVQGIFNNRERIGDLLTTHLSKFLFGMYNNAVNKKEREISKINGKLLSISLINNILLVGLNIAVILFLVWQIINGQISIGSFVSMLTASIYLRVYLNYFFDSYKQIHEYAAYSEKIQKFMNINSDIEHEPTNIQAKNVEIAESLPYALEIRNLSFAYPNSSFSINSINLCAQKGEKIAIVGENGAGKTTLVKLLLRLYDPDEGAIFINGINLRDLPIQQFRMNVGVAFQQSNVYALSFAENMSLYEEEVNENKIDKAIDRFEFDRIFEKTGANKNTALTKEFDENGIILSGGEMQQLVLSRLFTKAFGMILLDEASSALDPIAEYELNRKIFSIAKDTTAVIIAHRLSSIRDADRIYVVCDGTISEVGRHEQLMEQKGLYYEMFTKQAENYIK